MLDTEEEKVAWEEIKKVYENSNSSKKGDMFLTLNDKERKKIREVLKKYNLDVDHILGEHGRQTYEAW